MSTVAEVRSVLTSNPRALIYFVSEWHLPSRRGGQIDQIIGQLREACQARMFFLRVDVDEIDDICSAFAVTSVPEFIFMKVSDVVNYY